MNGSYGAGKIMDVVQLMLNLDHIFSTWIISRWIKSHFVLPLSTDLQIGFGFHCFCAIFMNVIINF